MGFSADHWWEKHQDDENICHCPLAAVAFAEPEAKPKADADPYILYGGYGLGHLGYAGHLGYGGYYGHGLAYYGKREAEAEPKADADPYLLYGGYRHLGYGGYGGYYGHGLGYGYYGKLKLSLRLMLTPSFSTEDTMDLFLDMPDTMVLDA